MSSKILSVSPVIFSDISLISLVWFVSMRKTWILITRAVVYKRSNWQNVQFDSASWQNGIRLSLIELMQLVQCYFIIHFWVRIWSTGLDPLDWSTESCQGFHFDALFSNWLNIPHLLLVRSTTFPKSNWNQFVKKSNFKWKTLLISLS